jgi:[ribosomal protein S5]-alanine N-acetyltransferase
MIIKTKDFILRHIKLSDLEGYFECQQDEKTKKGFMSVPKNISEARKELKEKIADYKKTNPFGECLAIEVDGEFAGYVEISHLTNNPYHKHKAEIGYCLHPKFRGKGITARAVRIVSEYAFKKYKLKRISGWCRTFNKASARVLEKAGFRLEGIFRKNKFKDGKYLDDMIWARVK